MSLEESFRDKTFRIDFVRKDKLTLPNLAVTIPFVIDSELAIKNGGRFVTLDSGISYQHATFKDDGGSSRVREAISFVKAGDAVRAEGVDVDVQESRVGGVYSLDHDCPHQIGIIDAVVTSPTFDN